MVAGDRCRFDGFAAERVRNVDTSAAGSRDTIAAMADMVDDETLGVSLRRPR